MSLMGVRKIPVISHATGVGGLSDLQKVIALYQGGTVEGALYDVSVLSSLYADRSATPSTPASIDGVVGTIKDLSGNGNHAIAPSDAARGILRTNGTYYWIECDGLSTQYAYTSVNVSDNFTVGIAIDRTSLGTFGCVFASNTYYQPYSAWFFIDSAIYCWLGTNFFDCGVHAQTGDFVLTSYRNLSGQAVRKNGTVIGNEVYQTVSEPFNALFNRNGNFSTGSFYGGFLIQTDVGANMTLVETWLASLNGVTLS
jgi:hypothetical protein